MARGQAAKQEIMATILETFGGNSFLYNNGKEIRVNTQEDGEPVQIKITFTAAKTAVEPEDENAIPGAFNVTNQASEVKEEKETPKVVVEATVDEKEAIADLMASLGIKG